ncbi:hypothetical protein TYRP_006961, partial [Tyrophagus putrescentiae]
MVPFDAERLVECPCASETLIARVLPEISGVEVPVLVSCIASTTGTTDSCQQTVCRWCHRRHSRLIRRTDTDEDGHAAATAAVADSAHHLKSRRRGHHGFSLSRPSDGTRARSELKIITVTIITTIRAPVSMLVLFAFPSFLLSFLGSNPWPRQSTLAVDLLKRWGTPAINGAQLVLGESRSVFPPCTFAGSGPSRYYCPSSDVGGPKRTVDKDGRLSEDGEAD